jgi:hypothetical protein
MKAIILILAAAGIFAYMAGSSVKPTADKISARAAVLAQY